MHQGIARHGGLAKDSSTNLIRRDEPASGPVPSNAILRFEKSSNAYHAFTVQRYPVRVGWLFYRCFSQCVFSDRSGQGGSFAFQAACELLASIAPGVGQTQSSLDILQSRLRLLHDQGTG